MNWRSILPRISGQSPRVSTSADPKEALAEAVLRALAEVAPAATVAGWNPTEQVAGFDLAEGRVLLALSATPEQAESLEPARAAIEAAIAKVPGVSSVNVVLTGERAAPPPPQGPRIGQHPSGGKIELPEVGTVIAVASGKGGVGKSTTTANLALAMAAKGLRVGVLDADIYGPSIPTLFGCEGAKPGAADGKMIPVVAHGVKLISIGFLLPPDAPVIWRGPMVSGAIEQLFRDVVWGALDVLLVDLPPGTGDAQLTMSQKAPLSGAVIVSTPQDLALIDARRALQMFRKVEVPVLGIIENMSYYECPNCGHREHIFAHGGAAKAAEELETPFLGEIPLTLAIREAADAGAPIAVKEPDGPHAKAYAKIAEAILYGTS